MNLSVSQKTVPDLGGGINLNISLQPSAIDLSSPGKNPSEMDLSREVSIEIKKEEIQNKISKRLSKLLIKRPTISLPIVDPSKLRQEGIDKKSFNV